MPTPFVAPSAKPSHACHPLVQRRWHAQTWKPPPPFAVPSAALDAPSLASHPLAQRRWQVQRHASIPDLRDQPWATCSVYRQPPAPSPPHYYRFCLVCRSPLTSLPQADRFRFRYFAALRLPPTTCLTRTWYRSTWMPSPFSANARDTGCRSAAVHRAPRQAAEKHMCAAPRRRALCRCARAGFLVLSACKPVRTTLPSSPRQERAVHAAASSSQQHPPHSGAPAHRQHGPHNPPLPLVQCTRPLAARPTPAPPFTLAQGKHGPVPAPNLPTPPPTRGMANTDPPNAPTRWQHGPHGQALLNAVDHGVLASL